MNKKAFTLVELIVVITILAILGTIGFISLNGYSMQARDAKRISDISSLSSKINIETIRGTSLSDLIEIGSGHIASGSILGNINNNITTFGKINFNNLRETRSSFLDPSTKDDYKGAYAIGMGSGGLRYNFFELGTISEKEGVNKIVGNYYTLTQEDIPSLFLSGSTSEIRYVNDGNTQGGLEDSNGGLIYKPSDKYVPPVIEEPEAPITYACLNPEEILLENATYTTTSEIENIIYQNRDSTKECYYECNNPLYLGDKCDGTTIYGDEGSLEKAICNAWVQDSIGTYGGGANNWLWVPARDFITDGVGIGMDNDYYKRSITHNGVNYTCNGFAVAKYEMSYEETMSPNSTSGSELWNTSVYDNNLTLVSTSNKYPIGEITQAQAVNACKTLGSGFHLITNNEWMTIARNIELNPINWSGGSIGNGYISNGLSNDNNFGCYVENQENSNSIYSELEREWGAKTGEGSSVECNIKRQLTLSNGQKIWDLSGNLWEHVNKGNDPINNTNYNSNSIRVSNACNGTGWHNYSYENGGIIKCDYINEYSNNNLGPYTELLNTNNGIGAINSSNISSNIFLRGAGATGGRYSGIYAISLAWNAGIKNSYAGFRCSI